MKSVRDLSITIKWLLASHKQFKVQHHYVKELLMSFARQCFRAVYSTLHKIPRLEIISAR